MNQLLAAILTILLSIAPPAPRAGGTMVVVLHVESATVAPLHAEVLLPEGMHIIGATSTGKCIFTGCNAVGTSMTMTETVQLDRPGTVVVTGYAAAGAVVATEPYAVTVLPAPIYLPLQL